MEYKYQRAVVAGTGFDGRDKIIKQHCKEGAIVKLKREPYNKHDPSAIAVYIEVPRFFGLLSPTFKQIGYVKARAAQTLAKKMDSGIAMTANVRSFFAPSDRDFPRVSLEICYKSSTKN